MSTWTVWRNFSHACGIGDTIMARGGLVTCFIARVNVVWEKLQDNV